MCGIAGIHFFSSKNPTFKSWEKEILVNDLLTGIEHRGKDATGIATIRGNGDIWVEKAELEATEFIKHRTGLDKRIKTILLHTRYATQGHQSNNLNNHPVINDNAVIIHNGHIRNDDELFKEDDTLNRTAQVDSEVIAALFNKHGIEKAHLALQELEGGFAVAAIDQRIPTALVLAKGRHSPLTYFKNEHFIIWASESRAIYEALDYVKEDLDVRYLDIDHMKEGDILYIDNGKVELLNFKVKEVIYSHTPTTVSSVHTTTHSISEKWDDTWEQKDYGTVRKYVPDVKVPESSGEVILDSGSHQIIVDGRRIQYRACFKCSIAANEEYLKKFNGAYWCELCLEDEVEWLTKDKTNVSELEAEDKALAEFESGEHMLVCEKIGKQFGISKGMVNYFLFECEELMDDEIENEMICELYDAMSLLYDIEVGILQGDDVEREESEDKKMEIVKFQGNEQQFIGL